MGGWLAGRRGEAEGPAQPPLAVPSARGLSLKKSESQRGADRAGADSGCKDLIVQRKGFDFDGVAGGITEEHRSLLPSFANETLRWRDEKLYAALLQAVSKVLPTLQVDNDAEVTRRNLLSIDAVHRRCWLGAAYQVRRQLMTEEIEIDPTLS